MRKNGKWGNMASQTRPYENLRLKTKFGLVNAIFSHSAKRREIERELGLGEK